VENLINQSSTIPWVDNLSLTHSNDGAALIMQVFRFFPQFVNKNRVKEKKVGRFLHGVGW